MAGGSDAAGRDGAWRGTSGRGYRRDPDGLDRRGTRHRIIAVVSDEAGPLLPPGRRAALLLPARRAPAALQAFDREVSGLELLSAGAAASPAPRVYERLEGDPGAVVEWCDTDLESWWVGCCDAPDAFRSLCLALADVCRRLSDWAGAAERAGDEVLPLPDIRPRAVLRTSGGRWVLAGLGRPGAQLSAFDDDAGTEMMTSASGYDPPEELFSARSDHPLAARTWAVGASLFSLLKVRALAAGSGPDRELSLPAGGTDSVHLRSHRAALIDDLLQRKPALFAGRPLDPRQFLYPDRLPDRDRRTVAEAASGLFGDDQRALESKLCGELLSVLDRALSIDPGRRFTDPADLAAALEGLAGSFRAMRTSVAASRLTADGPMESAAEATQVMAAGPAGEPRLPTAALVPLTDPPSITGIGPGVAADDDSTDEALELDPGAIFDDITADPVGPGDALAGDALAGDALAGDTLPKAQAPASRSVTAHHDPAVVPGWVKLALGGLALSQAATLGLVGLLWLQLDARPPQADRATQATGLLQDAFEPTGAGSGGRASGDGPAGASAAVDGGAAADGALADEPASGDALSDGVPADAALNAPTADVTSPATASASDPGGADAGAAESQQQHSGSRARRSATATGTLQVSAGGAEVRLLGPAGPVSPGAVAPGRYRVQLQDGEGWTDRITVTVDAGAEVQVTCGFGQCKQVQ